MQYSRVDFARQPGGSCAFSLFNKMPDIGSNQNVQSAQEGPVYGNITGNGHAISEQAEVRLLLDDVLSRRLTLCKT